MSDTDKTVRLTLSLDIVVPDDLNDAQAEEAASAFAFHLADAQVMQPYTLIGPHVGEAEPGAVNIVSAEVLEDEATEPLPFDGDEYADDEHDEVVTGA